MPLPKVKQYKEKMLKDNMVDPQMMFAPLLGMFEKEDANVVLESTTYKESNCDALIDENGMPIDQDVKQSLYMAAFNYLNRDRIRSVTGDSCFVSPSRNSDSVKRFKTTVAKDIPLYEAKIDEVLNRDTMLDSFKALYKDELALAKADAEKKRKEFKSAKAEFDRIMNDRNCTLSHKMIIEGRIRRGEWVIVDEDGNVDEETQEKIRNVEKNMREARKREAEKNGTDMNTNLRAAKEELKIPEDDDCEIF